MSDDFDTENENEGEGIKDLRNKYKSSQKQLTELQEKLAKYETAERRNSVAGILKAKGIPEAAAKFYDGDDTSEDAVGKWLEANADVFQIKTSDDAPAGSAQQAPDANALAAQRVTAQSFGTTPAVSTPNGASVDPEEKLRLTKTLPYEELEKLGWVPKRDQLHGVRRGQ
jgi:hypothetical protein